MINKNDELILNIESMGINGEGVARHEGAVIFVPYAITNEIVKAKIIFIKNNFYIAKLIEIIKASPKRKKPICPYFNLCGGCDLMHLDYKEQLNFKTNLVKNNLKSIGGIETEVLNTIESENELYYRNKFSLPIGEKDGHKFVGMFKPNSHNIIKIEDCIISAEWTKTVIKIFNQFLNSTKNSVYSEQSKQGLIKHLVCRMEQNQLLVCVVINGKSLKDFDKLIFLLKQNFEHFGLMLNHNTLNNNVILTNDFTYLYGLNSITLASCGFMYEVNILSFLQINTNVANLIYEKVVNEVKDEIVVNAYSGAGFLSAILSKKSKLVYGIEIVEDAHLNAEKLKEKNGITNLTNILGDVTNVLPTIKNFETIVLDPPRKGLDIEVVNTINKVRPNKIIYISCASNTLARDLKNLMGYKIKFVQPYDMFPQTKHVECVVCLEKEDY